MDSKNQQKKESKKLLSDFLLSLEEKGKMCFILKDLESLGRSVKSLRIGVIPEKRTVKFHSFFHTPAALHNQELNALACDYKRPRYIRI